ncbi:hypothetical protein T265_09269 [Opisthorchis viverrini]|uniref:Uncharacterized protein n=1 Tax=Opisthorchis viverrini TaxID=6198 RepID=A0A074Z6M1_OPIVI|nr:hypothetical protein T265_09269 [Opisthorchis viverrini]KER22708.1 hypothetical protein T265_09269 [Opisthorchis viverrini]
MFRIYWASAMQCLNRSSQPGQLLGRLSMSRAYQSHHSIVNTFACSDVIIQMRPTCVGEVVVTRSPRMSDVRGSNPSTTIGYALLMSSNKCETRVQCFPLVWTHLNDYARTEGRPFKRAWCGYEQRWNKLTFLPVQQQQILRLLFSELKPKILMQ